jgi:hypothetical protein
MQVSDILKMKSTPALWGGGPTWQSLPESHKPDPKSWTIKGTSLEKVDAKLRAAGYRSPWLRNYVWQYHIKRNNRPFEAAFGRHMLPGFMLFLAYEAVEVAYFAYTGKLNTHTHKIQYIFPPCSGGGLHGGYTG